MQHQSVGRSPLGPRTLVITDGKGHRIVVASTLPEFADLSRRVAAEAGAGHLGGARRPPALLDVSNGLRGSGRTVTFEGEDDPCPCTWRGSVIPPRPGRGCSNSRRTGGSAVAAIIEPHGATLVDLWYAFGESDGFAVIECADARSGGRDRDGNRLKRRVQLVHDDSVDDSGRSARGDAHGPPDPIRGAGRGCTAWPCRWVSYRNAAKLCCGDVADPGEVPPAARWWHPPASAYRPSVETRSGLHGPRARGPVAASGLRARRRRRAPLFPSCRAAVVGEVPADVAHAVHHVMAWALPLVPPRQSTAAVDRIKRHHVAPVAPAGDVHGGRASPRR